MNLKTVLLIIVSAAVCLTAVELTVVTEDWRPYNYQEYGIVKGLSTDIVRQVLDHSGITYEINVFPWSRSYKMALEDKNVLIYTLIRIEPREKLFKWVRPLGKGGQTSLYRLTAKSKINPKALQDVKKYQLAANENSMDHLWLKYNGFDNVSTPPQVENTIRMLFAGRIDMIPFDDSVIESEFTHFGFKTADVVKVLPLFKTPPYMALSLNTPDSILIKLQKAYDELLKSHKIKLVN